MVHEEQDTWNGVVRVRYVLLKILQRICRPHLFLSQLKVKKKAKLDEGHYTAAYPCMLVTAS